MTMSAHWTIPWQRSYGSKGAPAVTCVTCKQPAWLIDCMQLRAMGFCSPVLIVHVTPALESE